VGPLELSDYFEMSTPIQLTPMHFCHFGNLGERIVLLLSVNILSSPDSDALLAYFLLHLRPFSPGVAHEKPRIDKLGFPFTDLFFFFRF